MNQPENADSRHTHVTDFDLILRVQAGERTDTDQAFDYVIADPDSAQAVWHDRLWAPSKDCAEHLASEWAIRIQGITDPIIIISSSTKSERGE